MRLSGLDTGALTHLLRRGIVLALLPALVVATIAYFYEIRQAKTYQATATLYVEKAETTGGSGVGSVDPFGSQALASAYSQMITDNVVARAADRILAHKYPGYRVEDHNLSSIQHSASQVNVQAIPVVGVSVTDTDPVRAADAANAASVAFIQNIKVIEGARFAADAQALQREMQQALKNIRNISRQIQTMGPGANASLVADLQATRGAYDVSYQALLTERGTFNIQRDEVLNSVSIYSPAIPSRTPIGPHPVRTAGLLALAMLALSGAGLYLYEFFNDLPRSPEQVEEAGAAPVLGSVRRFKPRGSGGQLVTVTEPRSALSEAYRLVRTNIQFTNVDRPPRTLLITSALPQEGKSTTVSNLAEVFAQGGGAVTLIDADLRRPSLHRVFDVDGRRDGLTSLLVGNSRDGRAHLETAHANLSLVPAGPLPPNPADLLGSDRMAALLTGLREQSDMVLIDTPPVLAVADAAILSTMVDGVIFVVDPSKTRRRELRAAREAVEAVGGKVIGIVINGLREKGGLYYYGNYSYNQHYGPPPGSETPRTKSGRKPRSAIARRSDQRAEG